jgi:hypothetical protein
MIAVDEIRNILNVPDTDVIFDKITYDYGQNGTMIEGRAIIETEE